MFPRAWVLQDIISPLKNYHPLSHIPIQEPR